MRLVQIASVLRESIDELKVKVTQTQGQPNLRTVGNIHAAVKATSAIEETGVLRRRVRAVLDISEIVKSIHDEVVSNTGVANKFSSAVDGLRNDAAVLLRTLDEFLPKNEKNAIGVKLPESSNLADVANTILQLNKALEQALCHKPIEGKITLVSFSKGSNWIEILVGSITAFKLLAGMVYLIHDSRAKNVELEKRKELLRTIKIGNDVREKALNAIDQELEDFYEKKMSDLVELSGMSKDKEYGVRLSNSLKILTDLIFKGMEIHPPFAEQEKETKALFPDPRKLLVATKELPTTTSGENTLSEEVRNDEGDTAKEKENE
jgi:hypothetical protein